MNDCLGHCRGSRRIGFWRVWAAVCAVGLFIGANGCGTPGRIRSTDRYRNGIVYILPGIEGQSGWNRNIALGLDKGGVKSAIEIYDWTTGLPGGFLFNLADYERNRRQAKKLADKIVAYREKYPGRPVHIIGHSGGGGMAILALEALPPGRQIDMAILLAPALSPDYDLTTALRRTHYGIYNFYSKKDVSFLKVGTSLFGSIDRGYGESAGAVGFQKPPGLKEADAALYAGRLRQIGWGPKLERYGADGSHTGWTAPKFVSECLAPLITAHESPKLAPSETNP